MKRFITIIASLLLLSGTAYSQGPVEALRYSRINIGGTARYMGMGGAFGALGADFTSASTNPAGIGLYKSSDFSITPSVFIGTSESMYNGTDGTNQRSTFNLGNVGFVIASKLDSRNKNNGWKYMQFSTGLNRLANFNNRIDITGFNPENSLLNIYQQEANGTPYTELENNSSYAYDLNLAWWTYLLDLYDTNINNQYVIPVPNGGVMQSKNIDSKGSMNEYVFNFATNYSDRLFLGITFGIPFIRYSERYYYEERDVENTIYDFNYFYRNEFLETRGSGFNLKLGMIYRVNDWFRVGAAFHTPSWFNNMRDSWTATMAASYEIPDGSGTTFYSKTNYGNYNYRLTTPWRVQGNLGFIIGNVGLVSADYEFVDYSSARMNSNGYSFSSENRAISKSYKGSHIIRIGTEWRSNIFSFRAGANYFTSPFANDINDGSQLGFSGGVGLRQDWFFMDLAYAYTGMKEDYYLYRSTEFSTNATALAVRTHTILLTLGIKF